MSEAADFESKARNPVYWLHAAHEFAIAANYLGDWYDADADRFPSDLTTESQGHPLPMMVLYAAAAENLLKAIRVARGYNPVSKGELEKGFATHKLVGHAKAAGVVVTPEQENLLNHLRDLVESGKYPVAKTPTGSPTAWHLRFPEDVEQVWSLLEYLEGQLVGSSLPPMPKWNYRIRYRPVGYPKS